MKRMTSSFKYNQIENILLENEKLNEYLSRLDKMEQKVKVGN